MHRIESLYAGRADHDELLGDAVLVHHLEAPLAETEQIAEHDLARFGDRAGEAQALVEGARRGGDLGNHKAFLDRDTLADGRSRARFGH